MGTKRLSSDPAFSPKPLPSNKRLRGRTGGVLMITPPRNNERVAAAAPSSVLATPPPEHGHGVDAPLPAQPHTPSLTRVPRFDRHRAADAAADLRFMHRLNKLAPHELLALVNEVETRLRALADTEAVEMARAQRVGLGLSSRPVVAQQGPNAQQAT